jgi:hypothetical protein
MLHLNKQSNGREDQDTRNPKATDWEMMQKCYMTNVGVDNHLDCLSPDASDALIGHHLSNSICTTFDPIDVTGFKTLVKYLDAQYRQAQNAKTASGCHVQFSASVRGKTWLAYWHQRWKTAGNSSLSNCEYSTLDDGIHNTTSEMTKLRQRKGCSSISTASECSLSPYTEKRWDF